MSASKEKQSRSNEMIVWHRQPAREWLEALPVGNGHLGGMVFGGAPNERIQLNEDTLWSGCPRDTNNYEGKQHLPEIWRLVQEGKYYEAGELTKKLQSPYNQSYQPLGNLCLELDHAQELQDYRRELDLDTAIATVAYRTDGATFAREVFSTAVDDVLVVRLTCDRPGRITFKLSMDSLSRHTVEPVAEDCLALRGRAPVHVDPNYLRETWRPVIYESGKGTRFECHVRAIAEGGVVRTGQDCLRVEGADAVTLLVSAATSFSGFDRDPSLSTRDLPRACDDTIDRAAAKSYQALRQDHVADYQPLFRRVQLSLGQADAACLPTDERIQSVRHGASDPQLEALYFQFGRYLLISSSRPGTQPANLQGIWNFQMRPPWSSNYTLNINAQQNYWPAEACNLAECHEPLFDLIEELSVNGAKTAEILYGCRGWVAHHNTGLWRTATPVGDGTGDPCWAMWPMGGAWLCQHLWEHYAFGGDKQFLAQRAYPLMKAAARFMLDFLIEDEHGNLVTCPSTSPENKFLLPDGRECSVSMASTMDMAIIHDLFSNCMEASKILGTDQDFRSELESACARLLPPQVGRYGQLQEWFQDFGEAEPGHRHHSHLFGLHPGRQITLRGNPELAEACRQSLVRRFEHGAGRGGWPCAWIISFWARLEQPDPAYRQVRLLLGNTTCPNMFNGRRVYQIDGNLSGIAGMAEMLLQSHAGEISLLPALAHEWPTGYVKGLRARGGFEVDMAWEDGRLTEASIRSNLGNRCRLRSRTPVVASSARGVLKVDAVDALVVAFDTMPGEEYTLVARRGEEGG